MEHGYGKLNEAAGWPCAIKLARDPID